MKYYLNPQINESQCYGPPQSTKAEGLIEMTEEQHKIFLEYNGFVNIVVDDGVMSDIEPNVGAWEEWKASLPTQPTDTEPTTDEIIDTLLGVTTNE